ncbi:hypothetical protein ACWDTI_21370 [Gordonia sp. NPDC003424]
MTHGPQPDGPRPLWYEPPTRPTVLPRSVVESEPLAARRRRVEPSVVIAAIVMLMLAGGVVYGLTAV